MSDEDDTSVPSTETFLAQQEMNRSLLKANEEMLHLVRQIVDERQAKTDAVSKGTAYKSRLESTIQLLDDLRKDAKKNNLPPDVRKLLKQARRMVKKSLAALEPSMEKKKSKRRRDEDDDEDDEDDYEDDESGDGPPSSPSDDLDEEDDADEDESASDE